MVHTGISPLNASNKTEINSMMEKLFDDKWLQEFIQLLKKFYYTQYWSYNHDDEKQFIKEINTSLKEYLLFLGVETQAISDILNRLGKSLPVIRKMVISDIEAAYAGDPAAESHMEIILAYPGPLAVLIQRTAHRLYELKVPVLPRIMTEYAHSKTAIDIHPGAVIGEGFFIDHGTGVVIGETTVIGNNVKIYQGVTLGALSTRGGQILKNVKRHPTVEDDVTIYAGATILGGNTLIGQGAVIGGNAWVTRSVPQFTKVFPDAVEMKIQ